MNNKILATVAIIIVGGLGVWYFTSHRAPAPDTTATTNTAATTTTTASTTATTPSAPAAGPQVVSGPAADPNCYVPWAAQTKFFKYPAKQGPYRIALANGFIANT